jgi:valine--pyruvate aminotransferase
MSVLSDFGEKLSAPSGISELMDDLGRALGKPGHASMMGGGNPAHIPAVEAVWRRRMEEILATPGELASMLGDYDTPRGRIDFLETIAAFFNERFGWPVTPDHVAVTTGSQAATFLLFNMLGGPSHGGRRRIQFPLVPEYIGYAGQGIAPRLFTAWKPRIEVAGQRRFKYRIEFGKLAPDIAAIALSRPTNPTANLVTDEELRQLGAMAEERGIPLLVDNAYGQPFPNVIFRNVSPMWGPQVINTFSLSKLGLPGTRTGIVVAQPEIIQRLANMNATLVLATGSIGQCITRPLFASGEMVRLCAEVIRPFYEQRSRKAQAWLDAALGAVPGLDYRVHLCEGAFFLWLWLPGLPITDRELYERLKARGVLVVPGSYFFPGLDEPWAHRHECLRLTYCAEESSLQRGMETLADELRRLTT